MSHSVKDFDPRFLQLWRDASLKEIVLRPKTNELDWERINKDILA